MTTAPSGLLTNMETCHQFIREPPYRVEVNVSADRPEVALILDQSGLAAALGEAARRRCRLVNQLADPETRSCMPADKLG
jgi:hypothetical protein